MKSQISSLCSIFKARLGGLFFLILFAPAVAFAQSPVRIVVGFPPGGGTDVMARAMAEELSTALGRTFVVENRPGASGNIAAATVARAPANGETLLFVASTHATNGALYSNLNFDAKRDFAPVSLVASSPYVLVVNPSVPATSLSELTDYLKKHPGTVNFASASPGTGQHLAAEVYKNAAGVEIEHIPYKGSADAFSDLAAGRVEMMFDNVAVMLPHIKSGRLRPLAITVPDHFDQLPDVPTLDESGFPGFDVKSWFALVAPAGTPSDRLDELNEAVSEVLRSEKFLALLAGMGAQPQVSSRDEAVEFIDGEIARWHKIISDLKLKLG